MKIFNFLLKNFPVWHGGKRSGISEEVRTSHNQIRIKEGNAMPSPSYDDRLIAMFDSYCKEVSRNCIKDLVRKNERRGKYVSHEPVDYLGSGTAYYRDGE